MAAQEDLLFGKIAVKNKLADEKQVRKCLAALDKSGGQGLGDMLLEKGLIGPWEFKRISARVKEMAGQGEQASADSSGDEGKSKSVAASAKVPAASGPGVTVAKLEKMDF